MSRPVNIWPAERPPAFTGPSRLQSTFSPGLWRLTPCTPCARVLPMCQGESVTYVSEHSLHSSDPYCTAVFSSVPRPRFAKRTSQVGQHSGGGVGNATRIFSL